MSVETEQKRAVATALGIVLRERKRLYKRAASIAGYKFGESVAGETAIAWPGAGIFVDKPEGGAR
jgi:hypothetical protein